MLKMFKRLLVIISLIMPAGLLWAASDTPRFITLTDIHFDPFTTSRKSTQPCLLLKKLQAADYRNWAGIFEQYGDTSITFTAEDTNYALLKVMLIRLSIVNKTEHPQFMLILGDFLAHNFYKKYMKFSVSKTQAGYEDFVKQTFLFLRQELSKSFPKSIYPVIGNNDNYAKHYEAIPNSAFFSDMTRIWSPFLKNYSNEILFQKTFPVAGYYAVKLPGPKQKLIVLNSVLFSCHKFTAAKDLGAKNELKWLHNQLQIAKDHKETILIAEHIPLGVGTQNLGKSKFWQIGYGRSFLNELSQFPNSVKGIFSGHVHNGTLPIAMPEKLNKVSMFYISSAVPTPIHQPSFRLFTYVNRTGEIVDSRTFQIL